MMYAAITGWGKCLPPATLTNADLATFLETDDAWITSRTGIRERRVSHVRLEELGVVAARRALAAAGLEPEALDLVVFGTCSFDDQVPNQSSGLQRRLGAHRAAAMDVNTACTSFLYALSTANALIRGGTVRRALVLGGELISAFMDWDNRNVAVLFGDGCAAVVLEATDREEGLLAERLGCDAGARGTLVVQGMGGRYADFSRRYGLTEWTFDGQEIFKRAVIGMSEASAAVLAQRGLAAADVDLVVPHQANLRINDVIVKQLELPETVAVADDIIETGNTSAASIPLAMEKMLRTGQVEAGSTALLLAFGAGLSYAGQVVKMPPLAK